jgi:hypothetical protein
MSENRASFVIPAQAGIQHRGTSWIPARAQPGLS